MTSISIVGLSFRVPQASDLEGLWTLFSTGREVVGPVPEGRYHADAALFERMRATERPATFLGAFLEDVDTFDARHFGVSPVEARRMDPQQRLSLEESWRAFEDAGFEPRSLRGSRTGVFVGSSNHDYSMSMTYDLENADIFKVIGNQLGMISNRLSHFFDLRGPSFTLDTACSSAMVAIHTAMDSLRRGETDLALVGGVNVINSPHLTVAFSRARMLSNDGKCKAFSEGADGYVRGEAVVYFVLMRTEDALRDGRQIYAELIGSAVNQDGHTEVLTAPNVDSQVEVMQSAMKSAGVTADQLTYLEAHGTGTQVGDRVEYQAISRALRTSPRQQPCVIGTAKSYLGHAEPASGMVGILKTLASLRHDEIPRHRHFTALSPDIAEDKDFIALPLAPTPWPKQQGPRLAGISSFGFGGTNAHVILREAATLRAPGVLTKFAGKRHWKKEEKAKPASLSLDQVVLDLRAQVAEFLSGDAAAVSVDRALLDLGVDSLDLFTLLQRVESQYGVKIPLEQVLQPAATLSTVAELVLSSERVAQLARPRKSADAFSMFSAQPGELPPERGEAEAVAAYTKRTAGSKQHTQAHRAVLSDNRNTAGFRARTKEMAYPLVAERAKGSKLWDVDGNEVLDFTMGFGVHLFGHAPGFIHAAVQEALLKGAPLGPQSPVAGEVAGLMKALTGMDRFTFTNSGTEAVMLACRLARAATGREKVVIFEGSYHGTFDGLLGRREPSGEARPVTAGTTASMVADLIVLPWADARSLEFLAKHGESLAAVLVEPVQSRRPGVQPAEFLRDLRAATTKSGAALIFDEVITGFRCGVGGAQEHFGVRADVAVYGKVLGGGFPIGAVGGSAKFLDKIDGGFWQYGDTSAPSYELVFFAGTFCKHPVAMAAARATLLRLRESGAHELEALNQRTAAFCADLNQALTALGAPVQAVHFASLFRLQSSSNLDLLFAHLNGAGVYVWEGRNLFLSTAHSGEDLQVLKAAILSAAEKTVIRQATGPSAAQRRFLDLPAGSRAGHVGVAVQIEGELDVALFERSVLAVVGRHEIFSASFADGLLRFGGPSRAEFAVHGGARPFIPRGVDEGRGPSTPLGVNGDEIDRVPARLRELSLQVLDVAHGPLARFELLQRGPADFVFAVLTHGVLLDAYSLAILIHELALEYRGKRADAPGPQYRDYLTFTRTRDASGEAFWNELFPRGLPEPIFEPGTGSTAGRVKRLISPADQQLIAEAARQADVTTFMYLFTAFSEALGRFTARDQYVIAVPVADRRFAGGETIVGNLTQLMVLPQEAGTFSELLARNAALLPRCYERASSSPGGKTAQVLFNLEPTLRLPRLGTARLSEVDFPRPEARFELSVHILESEAGLRVDLDYLERALDQQAVEKLADDLIAGALRK
ncbi:MAG: aminotransferase class III-fold pyridoxal phosphate-dependent enzyme [Archangium sp.]|nr:aminotransferase class III-fold pyridoxal phosphate-dependent enzyme [Archangium sp.]